MAMLEELTLDASPSDAEPRVHGAPTASTYGAPTADSSEIELRIAGQESDQVAAPSGAVPSLPSLWSGSPSGAEMDGNGLDDETQRFILETHMENIGLMDFLGFELASLASQYTDYNFVPSVNGGGAAGMRGMSDAGAYITTLKSFVGMGILTLPFAATKGGYVLGPLILILVAGLSHHCMTLLLNMSAALRVKALSFGALGKEICGPWAKQVVDYSLMLTQYGFAVADLIFIVENVRDVVCLETRQTACPSKAKLCVGVLAFLMPLAWLKSLQVLTVPVLMSNIVLMAGISWVFYCSFEQIGTSGPGQGLVAFNFSELPVFFGMAVFSFEGIGLVLPIQNAMKEPSHFPKILRTSMIILGSLFSTFSFVGYVAYGAGTGDMIVFSIPQNKITSFLRLFYCLGVSFTYPVMLFPVWGVTEGKCKCLKAARHWWRRLLFRTVLVILTGVIGMQIPHFGLFLGLIGSIACTLLAFVLPALFHLKRPDKSDAYPGEDAKDMALIAFGAIGGSVSFVLTLRDLIATA